MIFNMEYLKETTYVNLRYFNFHLSQINYLKYLNCEKSKHFFASDNKNLRP